MSRIWLPAETDFALALREPNLLVPGKKASGRLRVDCTNPLNNSIELAALLGSSSYDAANKWRIPINARSVGADGIGEYTYASANNIVDGMHLLGDIDCSSWGRGVSVVLYLIKTTQSNYPGFIGSLSASYFGNFSLINNANLLQWFPGNSASQININTDPVSGHRCVIVATWDKVTGSATLQIKSLDSGTVISTSGSIGGGWTTAKPFVVGGYYRGIPPSDPRSYQYPIYYARVDRRAYSAVEIDNFFANPLIGLEPANDTPYLFPVAGGGGVSQELTGNSSTSAVGTLGVATEGSVSVTPSGVSATSAIGALGATAEINASAELTGVSSSGAVGAITAEVGGGTTANLSGNESAASVGTLGVSTEVNAFVDLLGNSATGAVGTLIVVTGLQVALSGNAAIGTVGTLGVTAEVNASAALTGVGSSGAVGTLEVTVPIAVSVELTGAGATGAIGTLTAVGAGQIWTEVPATSTTWTEIS